MEKGEAERYGTQGSSKDRIISVVAGEITGSWIADSGLKWHPLAAEKTGHGPDRGWLKEWWMRCGVE